jgi:hypothetical protein
MLKTGPIKTRNLLANLIFYYRALSRVAHLVFSVRKSIFNKIIITSFFKIASDWHVGLGPTPSRSQARTSGKTESLSTCHARSHNFGSRYLKTQKMGRAACASPLPNFNRLNGGSKHLHCFKVKYCCYHHSMLYQNLSSDENRGVTGFDKPSLMLFLLSDVMGYFSLLRVES